MRTSDRREAEQCNSDDIREQEAHHVDKSNDNCDDDDDDEVAQSAVDDQQSAGLRLQVATEVDQEKKQQVSLPEEGVSCSDHVKKQLSAAIECEPVTVATTTTTTDDLQREETETNCEPSSIGPAEVDSTVLDQNNDISSSSDEHRNSNTNAGHHEHTVTNGTQSYYAIQQQQNNFTPHSHHQHQYNFNIPNDPNYQLNATQWANYNYHLQHLTMIQQQQQQQHQQQQIYYHHLQSLAAAAAAASAAGSASGVLNYPMVSPMGTYPMVQPQLMTTYAIPAIASQAPVMRQVIEATPRQSISSDTTTTTTTPSTPEPASNENMKEKTLTTDLNDGPNHQHVTNGSSMVTPLNNHINHQQQAHPAYHYLYNNNNGNNITDANATLYALVTPYVPNQGHALCYAHEYSAAAGGTMYPGGAGHPAQFCSQLISHPQSLILNPFAHLHQHQPNLIPNPMAYSTTEPFLGLHATIPNLPTTTPAQHHYLAPNTMQQQQQHSHVQFMQQSHQNQQHQHHQPSNKPLTAWNPNENRYEKNRFASHLISLLPIEAQPSKTRQAYGMGKVWEDEFEALLGQVNQEIAWKLLEVETNPNLNDQSEHVIVAYRGHYVVRPSIAALTKHQTCRNIKSSPEVEEDRPESGQAANKPSKSPLSEEVRNSESRNSLSSGENNCSSVNLKEENLESTPEVDETTKQEINKASTDADCSLTVVEINHEHHGKRGGVSSQSSVSGTTDSGFCEGASDSGSSGGSDRQTPVHSSSASCASASISECNLNIAHVDVEPDTTGNEDDEENVASVDDNAEEQREADDDDCSNSIRSASTASPACESNEISIDNNNQSQPEDNNNSMQTSSSQNQVTNRQQHFISRHLRHQTKSLFPTRFRMFIDSAKVRFCCDECGHGWTSMKGRVVFWYELFELENYSLDGSGSNQMFGYCAYKLFGQQCDICKVEGRFERPMWYPEEVVKVLSNLCNKIGQVYFGFRTPPIDKQRRAGKPKTSHNSSLCQACHDGLCTDRK